MNEDDTARSIEQVEPNPSTDGLVAQSLRILIAEDDPVNRKVLLALLSLVPCSCDIAENGAEAIAAVMRTPFDLVLMDIQMPIMDGMTATRRIRRLGGDIGKIPIIAVTANAMQGDREKFLSAGMNDYVSKPINVDDLLAAIQRCTGRTVPKPISGRAKATA